MLSGRGVFGSSIGEASSPATPAGGDVPITFNYALRVWWAYYWPTSVASLVITVVIAFWLRALVGLAFPAQLYPWAIRALPFVAT